MIVFLLKSLLALVLLTALTKVLYNVFLHPLRSFPGPKTWAATRLPWNRENIAGTLQFTLAQLHARYGRVVRVGPDELSFLPNDTTVWKTIYSHRPVEMLKSQDGHGMPPPMNGVYGLMNADQENHARIRRAWAPAFTERSIREQEPIIVKFVDSLIGTLRRKADEGVSVDWLQFSNWTVFDMIGDLAFGEPFDCLKNLTFHPWLSNLIDNVQGIGYLNFALYYRLMPLLKLLTPKKFREMRKTQFALSVEKVDRRLADKSKKDRNDFIGCIMKNADPNSTQSLMEMRENSWTMIFAGGEAVSTLLSGLVYIVCRHPDVMRKMCAEIRDAFAVGGEDDISIASASQLEYLGLVIRESMRVYPPGPATIPRVVPGKGEMIAGRWVPGGTVVGVNHYVTYHSPLNFHDPERFVPERWLTEPAPEFNSDARGAFQPFAYGSRMCIGPSLANAEVRLILTRLFYNFDVELDSASTLAASTTPSPKAEKGITTDREDWLDQRAFLIWEKRPLMVKLRRVVR